jgi:hypothetical protein
MSKGMEGGAGSALGTVISYYYQGVLLLLNKLFLAILLWTEPQMMDDITCLAS